VTALGLTAASAKVLLSSLGCASESTPPGSDGAPPASPPQGDTQPVIPPETLNPPAGTAYLAVARGENPTAMVQTALATLGGIERFVKPGNDVIIKPNICVAYRTYEFAATTNPEVVGALVQLCVQAGATRVRVMDRPFGGMPKEAYARSGIEEAVRAAGGEMEAMTRMKYQEIAIPQGQDITSWPIYRDIVETDVLIDVPIAKHHANTRLTLGMKNLIGVVADMSKMHLNLAQRIADLNTVVRPSLTVVDGVRILMNNGPTGGSLSDVKLANTVIASHDIVAADSYAATLFDLTGADIPYLRIGAEMGLGKIDLSSIEVEEINLDV